MIKPQNIILIHINKNELFSTCLNKSFFRLILQSNISKYNFKIRTDKLGLLCKKLKLAIHLVNDK